MAGKRWTIDEDEFLLKYGAMVGYNFVASHDLGRPNGAGERRYRKLRSNGALEKFIRYKIEFIQFESLSGRTHSDLILDEELGFWESQLSDIEEFGPWNEEAA